MQTIKDLKQLIHELPDDMPVKGYKGGTGDLYPLKCYISSAKTADSTSNDMDKKNEVNSNQTFVLYV